MKASVVDDRRASTLKRAALRYAAKLRLRVLPLLVGGDEPHWRSVPNGARDSSLDPRRIGSWWRAVPYANVGIACAVSDLVVIDVDLLSGGEETFARLVRILGPLPPTWTARAPRGSAECYFRYTGPCDVDDLGMGVTVTHASHAVAPPSVDSDGRGYIWEPGATPATIPLALLPAPWCARLRGRRPTRAVSGGPDARASFLGKAFEDLGWLGVRLADGRRLARCPWADRHTQLLIDRARPATTLISSNVGALGGFVCRHKSCAERRALDVLRLLPTDAVASAARAFPQAYYRVRSALADRVGRTTDHASPRFGEDDPYFHRRAS